MESYLSLVVFLLGAIAFAFIALWMTALLRRDYPDPEKTMTYESGMDLFMDARIRFHIRYYVFALIFLVFDVETIFLYPWAVLFRDLGLFGFVEMIVFIAILLAGLLYAWKKKVLEWV